MIGDSGQSFALPKPPEEKTPEEKQEHRKQVTEEVAKILGKGKWGPEPATSNQCVAFPQTVKDDALQFELFETTTAEGKEALNKFLRQAQEPTAGAPYLRIKKEHTYFSDRHAKVFVEVWYYRHIFMQLANDDLKILAATATATP